MFLKFLGAPIILLSKQSISRVNVSFRWLNNVSGVYLVQVSVLFIGQQGLLYFFRCRPCFPLAGGLCKFCANAGGKQPIQRQPFLVQYKIHGNPLLSVNLYSTCDQQE
jgi:hypothetical protein